MKTKRQKQRADKPTVAHAEPVEPIHAGLRREYTKDQSKCIVTFWLNRDAAPNACTVALAGSFNNWDEKSHLLHKLETGDFALTVELEPGREYEFRFLIDETRWENAWNADKYVWSAFAGCENSVVVT